MWLFRVVLVDDEVELVEVEDNMVEETKKELDNSPLIRSYMIATPAQYEEAKRLQKKQKFEH